MSKETLEVIKSRRVVRVLTDQPIKQVQLEQVLEAARWAPVGGNHRFLRFVVIQDPLILKLLRLVSPGMIQRPQAVITICADWPNVQAIGRGKDNTPYMDIGAAMQTMLLAAHAIELGSGPVTSFNKEAVRVVLNLPRNLTPELMICIGHIALGYQMPMSPKRKVTWQSLVDWGRFPNGDQYNST
ncbi:MAG: nitroreductase family protein [Dehalococcoidia bacterium]|nr:nitroreductase family protein [Dehalococcoidia bacterium]